MTAVLVLCVLLLASFGAGYSLRAYISRRRRAKYLQRLAYRQAVGSGQHNARNADVQRLTPLRSASYAGHGAAHRAGGATRS